MPEARRRRAPRRTGAAPTPPAPREFTQARARATYERILRAALELYSEQGYHGTQTPDVAERAGISIGALYRYFADKHEIFVEIMHIGLEQNRRTQDAAVAAFEERLADGELDPREATDWIVDFTWNALQEVPADLLRTYAAMGHQDETFRELREQYDRYERRAFARVLEQALPPDRAGQALAISKVLDITVETLGLWASLHPGAESRGVKEATKEMVYRFLAD